MFSLPPITARIQTKPTGDEIFDPIRMKFVRLTPEESVRQRWIAYLQHHLGVPRSWIAVEYAFQLNGTAKRCDILVCNKKGEALLIIECKASHVKIDQSVLEQVSRYNLALHAPFLIISNGEKHHVVRIKFHSRTSVFINHLPDYDQMCLAKEEQA